MKKTERLHTGLWAAVLSTVLALGGVGCLASGLEMPVSYTQLTLLCLATGAALTLLVCIPWGELGGWLAAVMLALSPKVQLQIKTVAAFIMDRLTLGYGIPAPEFMEGKRSDTVLLALLLIAGLTILLTSRAVVRQKSILPGCAMSLLPLTGCITVTDTVPDTLWLFLWAGALVLLLMTCGTRQRSHRQANRLCAMLILPVVLMTVLLFRLVPRGSAGFLGLENLTQQIINTAQEQSPLPMMGELPPEQVDLTGDSQRFAEQAPVMEVTAFFNGLLYLRGRDYDEYLGIGWSASAGRVELMYPPGNPALEDFPGGQTLKGAVQIKTLRPMQYCYIPMYHGDTLLMKNGLVENTNQANLYQYQCYAYQSDRDWDAEQVFGNERYLNLPSQTLQWARNYLQEHGILSLSYPDRAEAIKNLVRSSAEYDIATAAMPVEEDDLARWFLEDSDTGYCVHYATAATVLLRAAGIPARYVEGYMVEVESSEPLTVRQADAHAWVEYYTGSWVVLDATAGDASQNEQPDTTEPEETQPTTEPETTEPSSQPDEPTQPDGGQITNDHPSGQLLRLPDWVKKALNILGAVAAAVLAAWLQYRIRRRILETKLRRGTPNRRGLALYRQICRISKFQKQPVDEDVIQAAQKAKFSHHTLSRNELDLMKGHLRMAQAQLSSCPGYQRLFAKWVLNLF